MKLDSVAELVADPLRWNSTARQNLPNMEKLPQLFNQSCYLKSSYIKCILGLYIILFPLSFCTRSYRFVCVAVFSKMVTHMII